MPNNFSTDTFLQDNISKIIKFRRELHKKPELSNQETQTAKIITGYLEDCNPDEIVTEIGGSGVCAVFGNRQNGKTIMFRAELDALPIEDEIETEYVSENEMAGHKCGHDGHMANLLGLALWLKENPPINGAVALLFQPAEETGEGSERVIADKKFKVFQPDAIVALHNLPGFNKHSIIIKEQIFTAASTGMIVKFAGATSHAAHPEDGRSPSMGIAELIRFLEQELTEGSDKADGKLATVIHVRIGEVAFGTTPGKGVLMATLRANSSKMLQELTDATEKKVQALSEKYNLSNDISYTERFDSTFNNPKITKLVHQSASDCGLTVVEIDEPFRWSEDFGRFTSEIPGVLFGLGAGKKHPQLHNPQYDYPDELLETAITLFIKISQVFLDD